MKLTPEELKKIYHGAYRFGDEDGYLKAFQYTEEQMEYMKFREDFYERTARSNAKTIEFITEAEECSFDYKTPCPTKETLELEIDGTIRKVCYLDKVHEGRMTFDLGKGRKKVVIYLPADATMYIKDFEIKGEYEQVQKSAKVLWMGDSITQGYGPFRSGGTYVSVANRYLNYEIINQGIGGYYYDAGVLMEMPGYKPDKIIVAHGTNQCTCEDRFQKTEEYFARLNELYPDVPTAVITPVWRGKFSGEFDDKRLEMFVDFCARVKEIAGKYDNITVIDGFKLMPHSEEYYMPDWLHPNALGCAEYGHNLANILKEINF